MMEIGLTVLGLCIAAGTLAALLWSIAHPSRRLWPPIKYTAFTPFVVWVPTLVLFSVLIALGVLGWGDMSISEWVRYGLGVPLILTGNFAVWSEVFHFGFPQTGGAVGSLRTDGLYRYSRNPQYVADIVMVVGWILLSAAPLAFLIGISTIVVLVVAPFSEEPWLQERYGIEFENYAARVRRFL